MGLCLMELSISYNRLKMHEESSSRRKVDEDVQEGALPAYLLDRDSTTRAKVCFFLLFGVGIIYNSEIFGEANT